MLCSKDLTMFDGFGHVGRILKLKCKFHCLLSMFEGFCYVRRVLLCSSEITNLIKMIQFYQSDEFRAK